MIGNLGYQFFKEIYDIGTHIASNPGRIQAFLETSLDKAPDRIGKDRFKLQTTYPGLTTGVGLSHGVHNDDNDFKIGFSFDHTTGLPAIRGSSVKGLLRSVFPDLKSSEEREKVKAKWLHVLLENLHDDKFPTTTYQPCEEELSDMQKERITALEKEIFEGIRDGKPVGVYQRDIFHDAMVVTTSEPFLGADYITPHPDPLKNPKPIKFLKILPAIQIEFCFALTNGILTIEEKLLLFKKILLTIGIGAKTNVGYGQFTLATEKKSEKRQGGDEDGIEDGGEGEDELPSIKVPNSVVHKLVKGAKFPGTISFVNPLKYFVTFVVEGQQCVLGKKRKENEVFALGEKIWVEFANNYQIDNPNIKIKKQ